MSDDLKNTMKQINNTAKSDFDRALYKGFWREVLSRLTQSNNQLLPFDEVRKHFPYSGQHYIGLKEVPIEQIVGSVGRYQDFDRAFLPRQSFIKNRWMSIDRAHLQDVVLPPIELYKISDVYFVKDGNHRVSVAREKGQSFIDAVVIEIDIPIPITPNLRISDLIIKQEQVDFLNYTHLNDLKLESDVTVSMPGQYDRLMEHISVHRWYLGVQQNHDVAYQEAVISWYDNVYSPLVKIIREKNILKEFPGRTEADLYLWITEHRYYLVESFQDEVSLEAAAAHFAENYSQRPIRKMVNFFKRAGRLMEGQISETLENQDDFESVNENQTSGSDEPTDPDV